MIDAEAANLLLELNGKKAMKRSISNAVEQVTTDAAEPEKNKRQKLMTIGVDTSCSMKMSLNSMLNSADLMSADHDVMRNLLVPLGANTLSSEGNDTKSENRTIIRNFWSKFFPEVPQLVDVMINDDVGWRKTLKTFFQVGTHKHMKQLISDFLLQKLRNLFSDVTHIPWKIFAEIGIPGWPENIDIENVWSLSYTKVQLLVTKLDEIDFGPNFAKEFEGKRYKSSDNQNLQKSICYSIRNTLSKQFGVFISNIPWKDLKKEDFINWPEGVPVVYPVSLTNPQKLVLNAAAEDIKLTDEALERMKSIVSAEIHTLRKEIISQLRLKLNEQLGFPVANVPWKSLKSSDIQHWPEEVPIEYPNLLSSTQNKQVLEHLEEMKFSEDFLKKMSTSISNNRYYQGNTSSHIAKDLRAKLNFQMKSYVSGIPWKDITPDDLIGWPSGVPVKHPHHLNASEKEKVMENITDMKFSDSFLERLKAKTVRLDLRKVVSSALRSKLAKQLGTVIAHIPWKQMTLNDISEWPADVPVKYPNLLTAQENKKIMDKMSIITFTPEFIQKFKKDF